MTVSLLTTKLLIPPVGAQQVRRRRLWTQLAGSLTHSLTLISAPAGYGKTNLLSDWLRHGQTEAGGVAPGSVAWVALDEADDDPVRFWNYVLAALAQVPGVSEILGEESTTLAGGLAGPVETALIKTMNALTNCLSPATTLLVLDDYHFISRPAIHDALTLLLEHLPPALHVIIASRADPPLGLARLRVRGGLLEIRAQDLRFRLDEVGEFLNDVMALSVAQPEVVELETRSEGWIAGLKLAALSLKGRDDMAAVIRNFSGQHHFVLDYLVEEVVRRQPEAVQAFLGQTSILEKLNPDLCEAVTGQKGAVATLAYLWHSNLFTEPLDESGLWYRRHHLLAEVLLAQLQRSEPETIPGLHARASEWYERHGFLHEAVQHALAAGNFDWVADCIEREQRGLIAKGEFTTLRGWLDALPADVLSDRPRCWLAYAWSSFYSGRVDTLEHYLRMAESALNESVHSHSSALRGEILALRAVVGSVRGEVVNTAESAQHALDLMEPGDGSPLGLAHLALGNVYRLRGQPDDASHEFEIARPLTPSIGMFATIAATLRLGQVRAMQGRLNEAARCFGEAIELGNAYGGQIELYAGEAHIHLGDIYRERNQLEQALEHVLHGIDLARRADNIVAKLTGLFTLLHVLAARGEYENLPETLGSIERLVAQLDFPQLSERAALHRAWVDVMSGDLISAAGWAGACSRQDCDDGQPGRAADFAHTLLARILIGQGKSPEALRLLAETQRMARDAGRRWTVYLTLVLEALAHQANKQPQLALTTLEGVLVQAAPEGYIRLFADEGESLWALLTLFAGQTNMDRAAQAYAHHILTVCGKGALVALKAKVPDYALVEPLSVREQDVLRLAAFGASNQAIAESLVISVGTVKSHVNRILSKLAAHNRTEAVARARELGLL